MVTLLKHTLQRRAESLVLRLVNRVVRASSDEQRVAFIQRLLENLSRAEKAVFIDVITDQMSRQELSTSEQERLFLIACRALEGTPISEEAVTACQAALGGSVHYSQEGEDILLERLVGEKKNGFFVDIGAHHARRFSNTYALYRKGWRGVNIDATPGSMVSFNAFRPDDTNLELAISDKKDPLSFNMFKEGALNTFDRELAQSYVASGWEARGTVDIIPETLADVLDRHVGTGQEIDVMSIDVEGEELHVLRSNDWNKYKPGIVIVEALDTPLSNLNENPVIAFLHEKGFVPTARLFNSIILTRLEDTCAA
ncbi:FkbM family methyltransferase [Rhizobium sp. SGZ-381]|uniref:FkbM family methyltransferase n=1 Tax=Rhizobium sp. SGZ-381 TaxID=3342800 RepID=UPI00367200BF